MENINIKEVKRIYRNELRQLCIANNYFTRGNNEEYQELLNITDNENISTTDIYKMALNIIEHSELGELDVDYTITDMMYELNQISHTFYTIVNN